MDLTGEGTGLSNAKIFSTLQLMEILKLLMIYLGISIGGFYELKITFERCCHVLNIEDRRMILIDSEELKQLSQTTFSPYS